MHVQRRFTKSRAGCITCKGRKKKCDEVKPRCAGCRRNQLDCEWPAWIVRRAGLDTNGGNHSNLTADPTSGPDEHDGMSLVIPPPMPVLYAGSGRPCVLTPQSVVLLGHYLTETAAILAMTPLNLNPFVTVLLPLSYDDDLLMHGLLALSGAHLTFRKPEDFALAQTTSLHHSLLVSQLRVEFASLREDDSARKERLLRVVLVLCQYEVCVSSLSHDVADTQQAISGDTRGNMFNHLRACCQLLESLSSIQCIDHLIKDTLYLSKVWYAYLVSCNNLTPYGLIKARTMPLDALETATDELETSPRFGSFFAGCHELYKVMPQVSLLAAQRVAEEELGYSAPSGPLCEEYRRIHRNLVSWTMPPITGLTRSDMKLRQHAAEALRSALHIFLETSIAGAVVGDDSRVVISQHVRAVFAETAQLIATRQFIATILWPTLIAGSCLATPSWQEIMLHDMCRGWFQMQQLQVWKDLLACLYADPDPRAFGPYGLYLMMEKHDLSIANG
jgi:hypothetical protein